MSAGLNRGNLDEDEYATFSTPSDYPFIDTLLHDCFDGGGGNYYYEVLVEYNYGPHYVSIPDFNITINKCSRQPKRGHDAHGSYKTNLLHGGGCGAPGIPSIAKRRVEEKDRLYRDAKDAIIAAIADFEPDPDILPGKEGRGPVGDESDWTDHPFVAFTDDGPQARMWDSETEGVCIHTSARKLDVDEKTGLYVQGDGLDITPVSTVFIDGEEWEQPNVAGSCTEYVREGRVDEIAGGTAYIVTE